MTKPVVLQKKVFCARRKTIIFTIDFFMVEDYGNLGESWSYLWETVSYGSAMNHLSSLEL